MNAKIAALQRWLNLMGHRPLLLVDGIGGGKTQRAFLGIFRNRDAPAVTEAELEAFAARLGGSLAQIRAVAEVESAGGGFLPSGRPKILWERHYFWRRLQILIPLISDPSPGGYTIDADRDGINDSWQKLTAAAMRSPQYAIESASWGKFQVMGAWWRKLGYPSALEFAWSLRGSEAAHYEVLARYIETFGGLAHFQAISQDPADCLAFAKFYNGPRQRGYDQRIAAAMARQG